jgi:pyridoxal biosynthesis lyase PdxS
MVLPLTSVIVALQTLSAGAVCSDTCSVGCCAGVVLESMPQAVRDRHSVAAMSNLAFIEFTSVTIGKWPRYFVIYNLVIKK